MAATTTPMITRQQGGAEGRSDKESDRADHPQRTDEGAAAAVCGSDERDLGQIGTTAQQRCGGQGVFDDSRWTIRR